MQVQTLITKKSIVTSQRQVHIGQGDGHPLLLPDRHQRPGHRVSLRPWTRHSHRRHGRDRGGRPKRDPHKRGAAPRNIARGNNDYYLFFFNFVVNCLNIFFNTHSYSLYL